MPINGTRHKVTNKLRKPKRKWKIIRIFAATNKKLKDMTTLNIRPEDVPPSFYVCFNTQCPRCADCLRFVVGEVVSSVRDHGPCFYPCALDGQGRCSHFHRIRTVRLAWGFRPLFRSVRHEDYAMLRSRVICLFGSASQFFRYNRGDYKLTPERQEEVFDVFRRKGYDTTDFRFAHYEEAIDFISKT